MPRILKLNSTTCGTVLFATLSIGTNTKKYTTEMLVNGKI